ncbi:murein transglycosylase [Devosia pacifica]|uniref:Murein transglycosylase n=1 Tax=Devosia pacifica TaxID=1335967 RepID=A0A918VVM0_9HYPH|nr:lytic murein transglycosylase [Devosia pacifica]GHA27099.1 murein transglycosylase [Devosia pacifica]
MFMRLARVVRSFTSHLPTLAVAASVSIASITSPLASTSSFVAGLWPEAQAMGVSRQAFEASFAGYSPNPKVMELTRKQPEFSQTVADYINKRVTGSQVGRGQRMRSEWAQTLAGVEERYGVQAEVVLAIWGMETNFGSFMGGNNTIYALATLTQNGYRESFFRKELLTALRIVSDGHIQPSQMTGSWAGAMGHTQFMPSSFMQYAVDYSGDGTRDIWNSIPDALASTANYLRAHGWQAGETWGYEITVPNGFNFEQAEQAGKLSLAQWQALGVGRTNGRAFPRAGDTAEFYMPAGATGPKFLMLRNFDVIKRYNNSNSYALAVGHLADRILGTGGFATPWPSGDFALNSSQRADLQRLLSRNGFDAGPVDGRIGPKTRAAIRAYQRHVGLPVDGYASGLLLTRLR